MAVNPDTLVRQNMPFLRSLAKLYKRPGVDADDLVQEGAIALVAAAETWRPDGGASIRSYARRPVKTAMRRHGRARRFFHSTHGGVGAGVDPSPLPASPAGEETCSGGGPSPAEAAVCREVEDFLAAEIDALPWLHAAVVRLRLSGASIQEVCADLGCSTKQARLAGEAGIAALQSALEGLVSP